MKELEDKMAISTGKFIGLTLASGGLYFLYYIFTNRERFNKEFDKEVISNSMILGIIITYGLSSLFTGFAFGMLNGRAKEAAAAFSMISSLLSFASTVLIILIAFKSKAVLEERTGKQMNWFFTCILTFFYINHFIKNQSNSVAGNNSSNIDDLEKFASMLEKGILTQDEFDAKKKELLGL